MQQTYYFWDEATPHYALDHSYLEPEDAVKSLLCKVLAHNPELEAHRAHAILWARMVIEWARAREGEYWKYRLNLYVGDGRFLEVWVDVSVKPDFTRRMQSKL